MAKKKTEKFEMCTRFDCYYNRRFSANTLETVRACHYCADGNPPIHQETSIKDCKYFKEKPDEFNRGKENWRVKSIKNICINGGDEDEERLSYNVFRREIQKRYKEDID